jgi:hypothetical protein
MEATVNLKMHNEKLNINCSFNIISHQIQRSMKYAKGDDKCTHHLVLKFGRKIYIGRPKHRWEDNIEWDIK